MRRLIVNADDFGIADAVNLGIIRGYRQGILTSTSILACGEAAEHAARLARENPGLGVGVHLCLTGLKPLLPPAKIPTITKDGRLLPGPFALMSRMTFALVSKLEIKRELAAQIERVRELGITPTHIDGHQHLHIMPGIFPVVAELAREHGVRSVRFPVGPDMPGMSIPSRLEKRFLENLAASQKGLLSTSGMASPDNFFGLAETGRLDTPSLAGIIRNLPEGTSELMCHPGIGDIRASERLGWGAGWQAELDAVTDPTVRAFVEREGIELISYKSL